MLLKGFRFGMLLQLAVGPVCLFIFQTALLKGFWGAVTGVAGVALIDALFIFAAISGIGALLKSSDRQKRLSSVGAVVVILFGVNAILGSFDIRLLPNLKLVTGLESTQVFYQAVLLTLSNPLTILFWAGVFSAKMAEDNMNRGELYLFGLGAVFSTGLFLTLLAAGAGFAGKWLTPPTIEILNGLVGTVLVALGVKILIRTYSYRHP
jgi:threonine/homoserine/homoserine lactone efflux protein